MSRLKTIIAAVVWALGVGSELDSIIIRQKPNLVSKTPSRVFRP